MEQNFKLIIEYDGTDFQGWQVQTDARTVQGEIQKALALMTQQEVTLIGAGRTDAGVHALGMAACFKCNTRLRSGEFINGLNGLLPGDISIVSCDTAPASFHARYDAKSKLYRYRILNGPVRPAIERNTVWFIRKGLDREAMAVGARYIVGRHDFKAFEASGSPRSHTVRNVIRADVKPGSAGHLDFEIEADGFLRYMVRNIVGTLVHVGLGKISPDAVKEILSARDRSQAPPTAPPQGLFLVSVNY